MTNEEWMRENISPITKEDLLRLASKIEVPEHPSTIAKHEQEMWDTLVRLAPNVVKHHLAEAWDEGYESGWGDENFNQRGSSGDADADDHPHSNPYREAGA